MEVMEAKVTHILNNAQRGAVNHQRNIRLLEDVYISSDFDEFLKYFLRVIHKVLLEDYKNPCVRCLQEFLAKFIGYLAHKAHSPRNVSEFEDDIPTHPLLIDVLQQVIKYCRLSLDECRYNACSFISQIMQYIGDHTQLDTPICDVIEAAMIDNTQDLKPVIRLQAVKALVRLQNPLNPKCPVISAYLACLADSNPLVRKEAVRSIAPNAATLSKLRDRTRDIDSNVRSVAFSHCAEIGIQYFKIVHRQFILKSGFSEIDRHVKKVFSEYLLPKWLTDLNGDYIAFLTKIKLDADESDILNSEELSEKVMEAFLQSEPIDSLIKALPLDDNKVIPLDRMKAELSHYWNILIKYLRKSEDMDEYLDIIIPELTPYCNYLERLISTQFDKMTEDWEHLDFQYMLYHLFSIVEHFDLSEEVGRRTLYNLLKKVLRNHRLQPRLLSKIVQIASKVSSSDSFTNEICMIISDIREPLVDQQPSAHDTRERNFKIAELTVKVNILEGDLDDAINEKDFEKARVLANEIEEYRRKMENLKNQPAQAEQVRVSREDPETLCWCLDLLEAVLVHGDIKKLSPSLVTCRKEFLEPLLRSDNVEIFSRAFKCLATFCVLDKKMAEDHVTELMVPIASYHVIPDYNKVVMMASISVIADLIRMHGSEFFPSKYGNDTVSTSQNSTKRRLYDAGVDVNTINNQMSVEGIINVFLDMLDDENEEIRNTAMTAIAKLILTGFGANSMVMSRLILKWYNPATQLDLQQTLGVVIKVYTEKIEGSKKIVADSVIPILTSIADAPRNSPLAEVNIDNVIKFLAAICDSDATMGIVHVHRDLAHTLIREISLRPADVVTPYFAKLLNILNIAPDNLLLIKELMQQVEVLLETEALDLRLKKLIIKFKHHLENKVPKEQCSTKVNEQNGGDGKETSLPPEFNTRRLRVMLTNNITPNTLREGLRQQTVKELKDSDKRMSLERQATSSSSDCNFGSDERQRVYIEENIPPSATVSTSSESGPRRSRRSRRKSKGLEQSKTLVNTTITNPHQMPASESSRITRSRSNSTSTANEKRRKDDDVPESNVVANNAQEALKETTKTLQVKGKKGRRRRSKKILRTATNSSEQSGCTIINPSKVQTSVVPEDRPGPSRQYSLRSAERLPVIVSETSDSA